MAVRLKKDTMEGSTRIPNNIWQVIPTELADVLKIRDKQYLLKDLPAIWNVKYGVSLERVTSDKLALIKYKKIEQGNLERLHSDDILFLYDWSDGDENK